MLFPASDNAGLMTLLKHSCATCIASPYQTSTLAILTLWEHEIFRFLNYLLDHCENNTLLIMKFAVCVEERTLVFVQLTSSFAVL